MREASSSTSFPGPAQFPSLAVPSLTVLQAMERRDQGMRLQVHSIQLVSTTVYMSFLLLTSTANCCYLQVTDQSVSYYTFSLLTVCFQPISELLHCLHVQEKHAATLLGLWC